MNPRWALVAIAAAGCGDNLGQDPVFTATGGARLALQWYGYADGTRQPESTEFYDTALHTRCTPQLWIDDVIRCVPVAEDAVFVDAGCTDAVGRKVAIEKPNHFIAYDLVGDRLRPARVYWAGKKTTRVTEIYQQRNGVCVGPFLASTDLTYYDMTSEIAGTDLLVLRDGELGDGRLGIRVRETDDGMRVPLGLRDRELDTDCTATARADGSAACEPTDAAPADYFRDPACDQPVILVGDDAPVPAIAKVVEPSGCASYHAVGHEVTPSLFRRDGDACRPAVVFPPTRVFTVEAPRPLPALERTIEELPGRRLQRIVLHDGALRFYDDLLFDTAMRTECRRFTFDDGVTRCIPATVAAATTLFTSTCVVAVAVAEVPQRTCETPAFATEFTDHGLDLRAIGDPAAGPLYRFEAGQCRPYAGAPGTVLHTLGPPIDPKAFMGAVYFGER